ncbi:PAAR domain-containing protein [Prescottella defluvii]
MQLRVGARLRSVTSAAELIVIRIPAQDVDLRCDGVAMVTPEAAGAPEGVTSGEIQLGKRYCTEDGTVELLCTKPGSGTLTVGDQPLGVKAPKAMPASD